MTSRSRKQSLLLLSLIYLLITNVATSTNAPILPPLPLSNVPPPSGIQMPNPKDLLRVDTAGLFSSPSNKDHAGHATKKSLTPQQAPNIQHNPFARDAKPPPRPKPPIPPPKLPLFKTNIPTLKHHNDPPPLATPQQYEYMPTYQSSKQSKSLQPTSDLPNAAILADHFTQLHNNSTHQQAAVQQRFTSIYGTNQTTGSTWSSIARHFTVDPLVSKEQRQQQRKQQQQQQHQHLRSHRTTAQKQFLPKLPYRYIKHGPFLPPPPPNPFILKWNKYTRHILRRVKAADALSSSALGDLTRHFSNILRVFVAGGLPTHINVTKLVKYGFGSLLTYRTTTVVWNDVNKHPLRSLECAFPKDKIQDRQFDGIECIKQNKEKDDAIAYQIEMPSLKTIALLSNRLENTIPKSETIPLYQVLESIQNHGTTDQIQNQSSSPLFRLKQFARLLHAAGASRDASVDNGLMETNIEETIEYFKGVRFDALNTVAEDMLHFTEKKEKRTTKETSETSATDTDTRNDAKTDANLLTSEIVIICKFIEKDVLNGMPNKIVGIHVLIDRVTVFRRGIVVTERKTPLCNSLPILPGKFGLDICIGGPSSKPFTFRKYKHVGRASEHILTVGSDVDKDVVFPFSSVVGLRIVVGSQLIGVPFLSMASAAIPIHPFMMDMLGSHVELLN